MENVKTNKLQAFGRRLKSMLNVDFKRMFTQPLVYIMVAVAFLMPIFILVMMTMGGGEEAGETAETFTNVWQAISSVSGLQSSDTQSAMSFTSMGNINLMYFLIVVFICVFISDDFRSGYAKNLFTVRAGRTDYVFSKSLVCFVGGSIMILAYFIGAMLGGAIAGLSFDLGTVSGGNVFACLLTKIFFVLVFVGICTLASCIAKQKLWLSILASCGVGIFLFTMIPMLTPLNAGILNVIMCLGGGAIFAVGLGAVSNVILNKTSLV